MDWSALLNQIKSIQKRGDSTRNPEKKRKLHLVFDYFLDTIMLFATMSEEKSKSKLNTYFHSLPAFLKQTCPSPRIQVFLKQKTVIYLQYLNGVERTVFGVCTTCRCGVTPEKSLSCKGVLSPPFNGVSTLVRAMRFWASWLTR